MELYHDIQQGSARSICQDGLIIERLDPLTVLGVFDGHSPGGEEVVKLIQTELPKSLATPEHLADIPQAINNAFVGLDLYIHEQQISGGAVGAVAVAYGETLTVGHVGDSGVVIWQDGLEIYSTRDHVPSDKQEYKGVYERGGEISSNGRVNGRLNVTRSIGDEWAGIIISPVPEVKQHPMVPETPPYTVAIATDGLWGRVGTEDAYSIILQNSSDPAKALVLEAVKRGSTDDIAVIVAKW